MIKTITHWVRTQRTDRTGVDRSELPQGAFVEHEFEVNAQSAINISRKRLCYQASPETRQAWEAVVDKIHEEQPEIASCCVKECVYRGFCPEYYSCGYYKKDEYKAELAEYRKGINDN